MRRASGTFHLILTATLTALCSGCESSQAPEPDPADLLSGLFSLAVRADGCAELPAAARARTYTAHIAPADMNAYVVTLSGATFMADEPLPGNGWVVSCGAFSGRLGCDQFTASRRGDVVELQLVSNDERHDDEFGGYGGMILEQIAPAQVLGIRGTGEGRFEAQTLHATLDGGLHYSPSWPDWHDAISCRTTLRLTFTRRPST